MVQAVISYMNGTYKLLSTTKKWRKDSFEAKYACYFSGEEKEAIVVYQFI